VDIGIPQAVVYATLTAKNTLRDAAKSSDNVRHNVSDNAIFFMIIDNDRLVNLSLFCFISTLDDKNDQLAVF
jgi:hypothetical protein